MPSRAFRSGFAAMCARISMSGMESISPSPYSGVGMRKERPFRRAACSKSGCASRQSGASERPATVNFWWTEPSRVPSSLNWKRTSRVGPSSVSKNGTRLVAPLCRAMAKDGFTAGEVPPGAGWE